MLPKAERVKEVLFTELWSNAANWVKSILYDLTLAIIDDRAFMKARMKATLSNVAKLALDFYKEIQEMWSNA